MKILISNDDGINAYGLKVLSETLAANHDVYVVAPDRERSGSGHSLTVHTPLRVKELEATNGVKRRWQTSGTPSDCVKLALCAILDESEKPDLVISGINHGPNLASDILYSGTVSCAVEASMLGIPSIAVSLASLSFNQNSFDFAADFIAQFIEKLDSYSFEPKTFLNINIPPIPQQDIPGLAITKLGDKTFSNTYEKRLDPHGKAYYWLAGELVTHTHNDGTDLAAIRDNKISITPLCYDMTKQSLTQQLSTLLSNEPLLTSIK